MKGTLINNIVLILLAAVATRILVGLQGYSGQGVPPKFGDYEAQRHWMELTLHTPLKEWYVETSSNPLQWWGIDYPPGSAYQSYLTGLFMQAVEPEAVALETSRGYESDRSKSAMRLTVLLSDLLILFPALAAASWAVASLAVPRAQASSGRLWGKAFTLTFGVAMMQPALILIDHGHFQYNGIAIGLTVRPFLLRRLVVGMSSLPIAWETPMLAVMAPEKQQCCLPMWAYSRPQGTPLNCWLMLDHVTTLKASRHPSPR